MQNEILTQERFTDSVLINKKTYNVKEISLKGRSLAQHQITSEGDKGEDIVTSFSSIVKPNDKVNIEDIIY